MPVNDDLIKQAMDADDFQEVVRLCRELGDNNSAYGFFALGWVLDEGKVGSPDKERARICYEHAIAAGSVDANRYLGILLLEAGETISARKALTVGQAQGDDECTDLLLQVDQLENENLTSQLIDSGQYNEASEILYQLAEQNSIYALLTLGYLYQEGLLGTENAKQARFFYQKAANLGSGDAYYRLGVLELEESDHNASKLAFEMGAELGDEQCQTVLSNQDFFEEASIEGRFDKQEIPATLEQLEKLAKKGSAYALGQIGWIYHSGQADSVNLHKAQDYYERAIAAGYTGVYRNFGLLLLETSQHDRAREMFLRGAKKGNLACMYQLSCMLNNGQGGPAEPEQAKIWLEKAAGHGHFASKQLLLRKKLKDGGNFSERLSAGIDLFRLAKKFAKEQSRNPDSEKLH